MISLPQILKGIPRTVDARRVHILVPGESSGPVLLWINRDMRFDDNWAYIYAAQEANRRNVPLIAVYNLIPHFLGGTNRHLHFKTHSLIELEKRAAELNVSLQVLVCSDTNKEMLVYIQKIKPGLIVTDFAPLRIQKKWVADVRDVGIPFVEVDAHNMVPARYVSEKKEWAAYTLRPKIQRLLSEFCTGFPRPPKVLKSFKGSIDYSWKKHVPKDSDVSHIWKPGSKEARRRLQYFINHVLAGYAAHKNDPSISGQSHLSPYLHYGLISAHRVVLEVLESKAPRKDKEAFLEEIIVRRELADNFCLYEEQYDSVSCFPVWAQETLKGHMQDEREYVYTKEQFEHALTHDDAWNAAQDEMRYTGKMHGYMRMYWAKKILEWTKSPQEAMEIATYLNDTYEMDGRDPNGYAGISWSIGGVHDRPWFNRKVIGTIRPMVRSGLVKKFDLALYIQNVQQMKQGRRVLSSSKSLV